MRLAGLGFALVGAVCFSVIAQNRPKESQAGPSVEFTLVPPAATGNSVRIDRVAGRVKGAAPGARIVLFAKSGELWWVQPTASHPFTDIQPNSHWKAVTHPGTVYAALLVDAQYVPPAKISALPQRGGGVLSVATATGPPASPVQEIQFGGYPWKVRDAGRQQGGQINFYDPANARVDQAGFLHLRVTRRGDQWLGSEVTLSRSLGYGTYRFVVRDIARLEPAAVFIAGPSAKMAIELSRWGRPEDKNAQYVIAPYSVPANTFRFAAPSGALTHWLEWQPDRVTFRTVPGRSSRISGAIAEHVFSSGVRAPGNEGVSLNLYVTDDSHVPLKLPFEVVVERFEFLP